MNVAKFILLISDDLIEKAKELIEHKDCSLPVSGFWLMDMTALNGFMC